MLLDINALNAGSAPDRGMQTWHAPPAGDLIDAVLKEAAGEPTFWGWLPGTREELARHLTMLQRAGKISWLDGHRVITRPDRADRWAPVKASVAGLFRTKHALGYGEIIAGTWASDRETQAALCVLIDDDALSVRQPAGPDAWAAMMFQRKVPT